MTAPSKPRSMALLCLAMVAVMALWFSASAVIPALSAAYPDAVRLAGGRR